MKIEKVSTADAEELLAIYAPYVEETAISFEYEVPSVDEFRNRIEQISAKYPYIKESWMGKSQAMHMQQVSKTERHMTGQWKQRYISEKTAGSWGLAKPYMRIWKNY